jgi:uracil-DNA glycosylase
MTIGSRHERLLQLKKTIEETISDAWLFPVDPEIPRVQGFLGSGPIMCVAERPSTGKAFPDSSVRRLYQLLDKLDIPDSHLTDVVKSRGRVNEPYPKNLLPHKEAFDQEFEIVQPRCVIAFGHKVFDLLQFTLAGKNVKIYRVHHYAYARRGAKAAAAFEARFRDGVRKCLQALK